jgi:hypothetical protein
LRVHIAICTYVVIEYGERERKERKQKGGNVEYKHPAVRVDFVHHVYVCILMEGKHPTTVVEHKS